MQQDDPSDRYIIENFIYINETTARTYYESSDGKVLIASWKPETVATFYQDNFRENAYYFAQLISARKPKLILLDCRHLSIEISYLDQLWYVSQTKHLWSKLHIKKLALIFRSNLAAQIAMEGLKDVAEEEGLRMAKARVFEDISEAMYWLNLEY